MSGGKWGIILGGSVWVGKYFGWVGMNGREWGWVQCLIMPIMFT